MTALTRAKTRGGWGGGEKKKTASLRNIYADAMMAEMLINVRGALLLNKQGKNTKYIE